MGPQPEKVAASEIPGGSARAIIQLREGPCLVNVTASSYASWCVIRPHGGNKRTRKWFRAWMFERFTVGRIKMTNRRTMMLSVAVGALALGVAGQAPQTAMKNPGGIHFRGR